jgi:hypothetical protein
MSDPMLTASPCKPSLARRLVMPSRGQGFAFGAPAVAAPGSPSVPQCVDWGITIVLDDLG